MLLDSFQSGEGLLELKERDAVAVADGELILLLLTISNFHIKHPSLLYATTYYYYYSSLIATDSLLAHYRKPEDLRSVSSMIE